MVSVPTGKVVVVQTAVREADNATAEQPLMAVLFEVNATVPVGENPLTVAVNVTDWPDKDGFRLETIVVVEVAGVPVPLTVSACVPMLSVTLIVLLLVPTAVGTKVTETGQFCPGLRIWPVQASVRMGKAVEFDLTLLMVSVPPPARLLLVTLKVSGAPIPPL